MGEEAKQAEVKATDAPKQEEKPATEQKEEKQEEEKKEEAKPSPPPPIVLFVELHCVGCAKKIERSILKCRGVEEVEMKIEKNEVAVKGIVDPQALCARIQKKTSRNAKVLSPLPPPHTADSTKAEPPPPPQVSGITTVELIVNMHCEACAQQLRKKIMKMKGVQAAETDLNARKVTVTGTMNGDKLVEYIYRRTGKIATVIPPPPPPPPPQEEKKAEDTQKPPEEKKDDNKKGESGDKKPSEGNKEEKPASGEAGADQQPKKDEAAAAAAAMAQAMSNDEEMVKRMMYWNGAGGYMMNQYHDDEMSKRMMMMHHWMPMHMPMQTTMYVVERPQLLPPPQMFSDENPNACSIS